MTYPRQQPGQTLEQHQAEMAAWMGATVEEMNKFHDPCHRAVCAVLSITSQSLRHAAGEEMTARQYHLASIEEEAILHFQRLLHQAEGTLS